jgi:hypothetical protein
MMDNFFDKTKIYKVVIKECEGNVKAFRGYIIDSTKEYITLKFIKEDIKLYLNHTFIISIAEVKE